MTSAAIATSPSAASDARETFEFVGATSVAPQGGAAPSGGTAQVGGGPASPPSGGTTAGAGAPPQSHAPNRVPSFRQVCAPRHAPGPRQACVAPGKQRALGAAGAADGADELEPPNTVEARRHRMIASLLVMIEFTGSTPLRSVSSRAEIT